MREHKYRAWDIKNKRMIKSVGFRDTDCGRYIIEEAYMVGGGKEYNQYNADPRIGKQFILMQFT